MPPWLFEVSQLSNCPAPSFFGLLQQLRWRSGVEFSGQRCVRHAIDAIDAMLDPKNLRAVEFHVHEGLIPGRKPEVADLLVFAHEIGSCDPKGKAPCRMSRNFDDGEFTTVNPYLPFEQVRILSLGNCVDDKTVVDT